jgi:site-specific DNA-methyltransferase (adenine-specific)
MNFRIHQGDVLTVLQTMPDQAYDSALTDPPYGISFMGKQWDHGVPSAEVWTEVLRVLKPGAFLLAFGGTRTSHRLTCAIEDAGFAIKDAVAWLYASGFPKSLDISKAIDRAAGAEREVVGINQDYLRRKPNGMKTPGATAYNYSNSQFETDARITAPATPEALRWAGYGTALKPAFEIITVAMKPLDKGCGFAQNALRHGVAGLNIDASRIGTTRDVPASLSRNKTPNAIYGEYGGGASKELNPNIGRWPANLILDPESAAELDAQSGTSASNWRSDKGYETGMFPGKHRTGHGVDDSGGASRFFYIAKADPTERQLGGKNTHPTLKPIDLVAYLARLILPPQRSTPRRLLVPYSGSGSEVIGGLRAGFEQIDGIELEAEYVEFSRVRITADAPLFNVSEAEPELSAGVKG